MIAEEYGRICGRLAREALRYAAGMVEDEDPTDVTDEREHWIEVYLDEHLPSIDADVLLDVTQHADAFERSAGHPAPSRGVAARHAFQTDVWAAIEQSQEGDPRRGLGVAR